MFFLSPALLLVVPGLVAWWRSDKWRAEWVALVGVIGTLFLFNASSAMWWGGYAIGPRYILQATPFLALPIASWLGGVRWKQWLLAGLGAISALSVWIQTITSLQYYPPESYHFPLIEYSLPLLRQGQIAINIGNAFGLQGPASMLPLILALLIFGGALWRCVRQAELETR